jgi:exosome complex RNA-binding protein Rrp42 (RNase PH superfamily)
VKVGNHWLLDPSLDEQLSMDTIITIATTGSNVCTIQKGKGSLTKEELMNNVDISFSKWKDVMAKLE